MRARFHPPHPGSDPTALYDEDATISIRENSRCHDAGRRSPAVTRIAFGRDRHPSSFAVWDAIAKIEEKPRLSRSSKNAYNPACQTEDVSMMGWRLVTRRARARLELLDEMRAAYLDMATTQLEDEIGEHECLPKNVRLKPFSKLVGNDGCEPCRPMQLAA